MPQTVQADIGRLLAVEPDASQAEALRQFVREGMKGADLVIVSSAYAAVVAINRQLPDVVLFSESIVDKHRDRVLDHLRSTIKPAVPQRLTLPSLRHCDRTALASQITKLVAKAQELRPRTPGSAPAAAPTASSAPVMQAAPPAAAPASARGPQSPLDLEAFKLAAPSSQLDLETLSLEEPPSMLAEAVLQPSDDSGFETPTMLDAPSLKELESLVSALKVDPMSI